MPRKTPASEPGPLTPVELRALRELARRPAMSRTRLEEVVGSSNVGRLPELGLIAVEELVMDHGTERAWVISAKGREAIKGAAHVLAPSSNGEAQPDIGALAPWFGAARVTAGAVGEAMRGCKFVGIPFCGSLCEVPLMFQAGVNAIACNDAHRHLINMARCLADGTEGPRVYRRLRRQPFNAEVLCKSQEYCAAYDPEWEDQLDGEAAFHYFITAWMGRSAESGKRREFDAGLAIRYGAGGGNSVLRYFSAVKGLRQWRSILERCSFSADDAFEFLARCNDRPDGGVYCDPPWPIVGKNYKHAFDDQRQAALAESLMGFKAARVVVRTGGGPLIERLYPKDVWSWRAILGRNQANAAAAEYLLVRENQCPAKK